jgi:hypothetical protein
MSCQNSLEILDEIIEVLREKSVGTIKIIQINSKEVHSGAQDSGGSSEVSCDINSSDSCDISHSNNILTLNNTTPNTQCKIENFDPKSLRVGDIIMLSIIVAAIRSHLIPAFDINMDTIKCHESKAAAAEATAAQFYPSDPANSISSESTRTKNVFPSLSFTDTRNSFCLTFSAVSVFGEIVIYSSRKNYNETKTKKQNSSNDRAAGKSTVQIEKKKKIQTLYLNPDSFISFAPSDGLDLNHSIKEKRNENDDIRKCDLNYDNENNEDDLRCENNDVQFIQNYGGSNHDTDNIKNNKITTKTNTEHSTSHVRPEKGLKKRRYITELNSSLACVQIGTYAVKLSVLTSRITKALLDPLFIEK